MSTLQCDAALSDLVLQAAREAMPKDPGRYHLNAGLKNNLQLALLAALLDATKVVAAAVADNAWDDCKPIPSDIASELALQARQIASDIENATQCPDASDWGMPSMSAKELV